MSGSNPAKLSFGIFSGMAFMCEADICYCPAENISSIGEFSFYFIHLPTVSFYYPGWQHIEPISILYPFPSLMTHSGWAELVWNKG